jgi:hypothetical protein
MTLVGMAAAESARRRAAAARAERAIAQAEARVRSVHQEFLRVQQQMAVLERRIQEVLGGTPSQADRDMCQQLADAGEELHRTRLALEEALGTMRLEKQKIMAWVF